MTPELGGMHSHYLLSILHREHLPSWGQLEISFPAYVVCLSETYSSCLIVHISTSLIPLFSNGCYNSLPKKVNIERKRYINFSTEEAIPT